MVDEITGMEGNRFLVQTVHLSPYITEVQLSELDESIRREISSEEIAVTLNGVSNSAWSIHPECSVDRNNCLFKLAIGKPMSEGYRWKDFRSVSVLGMMSKPGVLIVTLCSNDSIAKLVVRIEENHPFNTEYCFSQIWNMDEPWKTLMHKALGHTLRHPDSGFDIAPIWTSMTTLIDKTAAHLARKALLDAEFPISNSGFVMGRAKSKTDPKPTMQTRRSEEERSRRLPRPAVTDQTNASASTERRRASTGARSTTPSLQTTPSASTGAGRLAPPRSARRESALASTQDEQEASEEAPAESSQLGDTAHTASAQRTPLSRSTASPMRSINNDILAAADSPTGGSVATGNILSVRDNDVRNIINPRKKPDKVTLVEKGLWSSYPAARALDATVKIPDLLVVEAPTEKVKKNDDPAAALRLKAKINDQFTKDSDYMYIFGREQIFELGITDMEPTDHKSGKIYRDYEAGGSEEIKRNLLMHNYVKPILTVMPNTQRRPTSWKECVEAGKFKIINGQHTWHAANAVLLDEGLRTSNPRLEDLKVWDVQVVWTDKVSHLHALSFKCNEGQNEKKHLTSLLRAILHCRVLYEQEGKPPQIRKNASTKKKKNAEAPEVTAEQKMKYEVRNSPIQQVLQLRTGVRNRRPS